MSLRELSIIHKKQIKFLKTFQLENFLTLFKKFN